MKCRNDCVEGDGRGLTAESTCGIVLVSTMKATTSACFTLVRVRVMSILQTFRCFERDKIVYDSCSPIFFGLLQSYPTHLAHKPHNSAARNHSLFRFTFPLTFNVRRLDSDTRLSGMVPEITKETERLACGRTLPALTKRR